MSEQTIYERLAAPFHADELEWRVGRGGMKDKKPWAMLLCYMDARAVMRRLDAVVGPENWMDEYRSVQLADGKWACICRLSIRVPEGSGCARKTVPSRPTSKR